MIRDGQVPDAVNDLCQLLLRRSFKVRGYVRGGTGAMQLTLEGPVPGYPDGPTAWIQILADRGQPAMGLRLSDMAEYIDPQVWAAHIDGTVIGDPDFESQASFVRNRMPDAAAALRADAQIEEALVRAGRKYLRRRNDRRAR
ncbi:MAG TPA: hypothetical protein VFQ44_30555 [Streptosporangiaceae bacterium]|nr:hypothetical protein [Streptosporangiaceae bacterium]